MKAQFKESFAKDLRRVRDKALLDRVRSAIEAVEQANTLADIPRLGTVEGLEHVLSHSGR